MLCCAVGVSANLVSNGSFETADSSGGGVGFVTRTQSNPIDGWLVLADVDQVRELWAPADGDQSVDLNATNMGRIAQQLTTVAGAIYELSFMIAGNPTAGYPPTMKEMRAAVADTPTGAYNSAKNYVFDVSQQDNDNMGWRQETWLFTAVDTTTWLRFEGITGGPCGVAIDDVDVELVQLPEPATLLVFGLGGLLAWRKR